MWAVRGVGEPMPEASLCRIPGSLIWTGDYNVDGEKTFQPDLIPMVSIHESHR